MKPIQEHLNVEIKKQTPRSERNYWIGEITKEVQKYSPITEKGVLGRIFHLKPCDTSALKDFYFQMLNSKENKFWENSAHYFFAKTKIKKCG